MKIQGWFPCDLSLLSKWLARVFCTTVGQLNPHTTTREPVYHNYWACALLSSCSATRRSCVPQFEKAHAVQWTACAPQGRASTVQKKRENSVKPQNHGFPGWWKYGGSGKVVHLGKVRKLWDLPPSLTLCIPSTWLFLGCILYNKFIIISTVFSWVLWAILAKCEPDKGAMETHDL